MVGALRLPTLQDVGEGGGCASFTDPTGRWRGWWVRFAYPPYRMLARVVDALRLPTLQNVGEGGGCASLTHPTGCWRGWWVRFAYPPYRTLARVVGALRLPTLQNVGEGGGCAALRLPTLHKTSDLYRRAGKRSAPAEPRIKRRPLTTPYAGRNTRNECSLYSRPGSLTAPRRIA